MWAIVDQAGVRRLLGDAREVVLPAVEFPSCTAVHEVSRTVSYECLCERCIAIEPNGTCISFELGVCTAGGTRENEFHVIPSKLSCRLDIS